MNSNMFLLLVLALLSGCSTIGSDRNLHLVDCTSGAKRDDCLAVANLDKKTQKKTVIPEKQIDRRARLAKPPKIVENKKLNNEKAKAKTETLPLAQDNAVVSKPDLKTQKQIDSDNLEKAFSASMDCVKNNIRKKDDVRSNVRAVAYELALLCRKKGVPVDSIANASIPLVSQSRAPKNTK